LKITVSVGGFGGGCDLQIEEVFPEGYDRRLQEASERSDKQARMRGVWTLI
jgi:hypothetical protein